MFRFIPYILLILGIGAVGINVFKTKPVATSTNPIPVSVNQTVTPVTNNTTQPKRLDKITYGDVNYSINVGGVTRTFTMYVPKSYDGSTSTPLIFVFHGGGSNNKNVESETGFDALAENNNFLVAYPLGTVQNKNSLLGVQASWNAGPVAGGYANSSGVDDIAFVKAMVRDISGRYNVDSNRIYSTGISMGGMLSYRIACELSNTFAAIAPIGAAIAVPIPSCTPERAIPVIHFHGTADPFIPYYGGPSSSKLPKILVVGGPYPSVNTTISTFKNLDKTVSDGQEVYSNGNASCVLYSAASPSGADVELCTITGGGHTWPGSKANSSAIIDKILGPVSQDINASQTIWDFFVAHPKN